VTHAEKIELRRVIFPGNDKNSIRIFPPTNITAKVSVNPTFYQESEIKVALRLDGLATRNKDHSIMRWRLRRLNWRIEEDQQILSTSCPKHTNKVPEGRDGISIKEKRTIGEHEVNPTKNPWKADYTAGEIESEFIASLSKHGTPTVSDPSLKLEVSHMLVVEMVVSEEWAPVKKPNQATPTGSARILRAQFPLTLTQRPGLGVAWDEETPPIYQDVPPSPPHYQGRVENFNLDDLESGSIESLDLNAVHLPAYDSAVASSSAAAAVSPGLVAIGSPARRPLGLSAADLLEEPPELPRRRDDDEEEEAPQPGNIQ